MFENSLIALDRKKQRSKRWLSLPLAVGLHLVVLVSLGFAQYWNVGGVPEPDVIVVFHQQGGSLPAPPPGEKKAATAPTKKASVPPVPQHTALTQPETISEKPLQPAVPDSAPSGPIDTTLIPTTGGGGDKGTVPGSIGDCTGPDCTGTGKGDGHGDTPAVVDTPLIVGGAVTKPVILDRVEPQYTEAARRAHLEGTVIVQAVIDEQGRVVDARILKKLSMGLDQSAVDAVSRWRFQPATLHGRPVKVYYSLTVVFRMQ